MALPVSVCYYSIVLGISDVCSVIVTLYLHFYVDGHVQVVFCFEKKMLDYSNPVLCVLAKETKFSAMAMSD